MCGRAKPQCTCLARLSQRFIKRIEHGGLLPKRNRPFTRLGLFASVPRDRDRRGHRQYVELANIHAGTPHHRQHVVHRRQCERGPFYITNEKRQIAEVHIAVADILAERINSGDGTEFGWRGEFLFGENLGGVILLDPLTARI